MKAGDLVYDTTRHTFQVMLVVEPPKAGGRTLVQRWKHSRGLWSATQPTRTADLATCSSAALSRRDWSIVLAAASTLARAS